MEGKIEGDKVITATHIHQATVADKVLILNRIAVSLSHNSEEYAMLLKITAGVGTLMSDEEMILRHTKGRMRAEKNV